MDELYVDEPFEGNEIECSTMTKIDSYRKLQNDLGRRQTEVLNALDTPLSNREIAEHLNLPVNSVTGRVKELRERGLVCANRTKYDNTTERTVVEWKRITNLQPTKVSGNIMDWCEQ